MSEGPGTALHVFAAGINGDMLEFYKEPNPAPWLVYDHTNDPDIGGTTVAGPLATYSDGPGAALHVFAEAG